MAKQNSLPSVDAGPMPGKPVTVQLQPEETIHGSQKTAVIITEGFMARRVDVKLPMKHRRILHAKLRQLQDAGSRLADGTEVSDKTKAVLWILENEVVV